MLLGWWANAQTQDQRLLAGNMAAAGLTALHLALLGSPLGMAAQLLGAARFALARRGPAPWLAAAFALLAMAQGALLAQHWSEWCVVAAAMLSSVLVFQTRGTPLRIGLLVCCLLNLTLSVSLWSWSGMLYQSVTIALLVRQLLPALKWRQPAYTVQ
ncbi:YgjV family protein [Marinobacter hydrocarbonoclasticus]|nr:YgjV family protein [Marinobacter nauticus]